MIYQLMSIVELKALYEKTQKPITVRFPKNDKQTFLFCSIAYYSGLKSITLYNEYKCVETSVTELLVGITWEHYVIHRLRDEQDYGLAVDLLGCYISTDEPLLEAQEIFVYLLSLVVEEYESLHYPIASLSTLKFIDQLLEDRNQSWSHIRTCLGYADFVTTEYVKSQFLPVNLKVEHLIKVSHFFQIPMQAFIVGGYGFT